MPAPATILVVDDDKLNRALLNGILSSSYHVLEADSAGAALETLERESVDLVLLDVMMPGTSGFDACKQIKAMHTEGFLPVLLVTALEQRESRHQGLSSGADDYLTKPIDRRELLLRVQAFLRLREQDRLIRSQFDALVQLDAFKDDLMSLLVHDLRNPLAAVMGILQIMQASSSGDSEVNDDVLLALAAARQLQETIDDLARARQLEEGTLALEREPIAFEALVSEAMMATASAASVRGVPLVLDRTATSARVNVDRALVRRAIEHLLAHALRYSPRKQPIDISLRDAEQACVLEVADRGSVIPTPVKEALFTKFGSLRQGSQPEARRGCGLAFYLVQLVMNAHGGAISVHDRDGGGTVFRMRLARSDA